MKNPELFRRLVVVVAAIGGLAAAILPQLEIRLDLSFFLPRKPPLEHLLVVDRLRDTAGGMVLVGISAGPSEILATASDSITEALGKSGHFTAVANGRSIPFDMSIVQPLVESRYLLADIRTDTFAEHNLLASLQRRMTGLTGPRGRFLRDLLFRDPTGTIEELVARWKGQGPGISHGVWMNDAGTRALVIGWTLASAMDLVGQRNVSDTITHVAAPWLDEGLTIEASGPGLLALASSEIIRDEMMLLSLVGALAVALILLSTFRSFVILAAVGLPLAVSVLIGAAAVQFLFGHVHGIALTFGATLAGLAIDYPLHLAVHRHKKEAPATTVERLSKPLMLSALTTAGAFLAVAMADLQGLAQLGTLASVGMVAAYFLSRWVMPWLVPSGTGDPARREWKAMAFVATRTWRFRYLLLGLLFICGLVALVRSGSIWENDIASLGVLPFEVREKDRVLRKDARAPDARRMLIVRGENREQVLLRQEALRPALMAAQEKGAMGSFEMAADLLPSVATQRARQRVLPESPELLTRLKAPADSLGIDIAVLKQFVDDVEEQRLREPLRVGDLPSGPLVWRLETLLRSERGGVTGLVPLSGAVDAEAMIALADAAGPEVFFLDLRSQTSRLLEDYRRSAARWLAIGAAAGFVVLFLGLRDLGSTLRATASAAAAVGGTMIFLVLCEVPLTLFHLLGFLLVGGIGIDYALFFSGSHLRYFRGGENLRSIALCGASTITVFAVLAFSSTPVLHQIGMTVSIGIGLAVLSTFAFHQLKVPMMS